MTARFPQVVFAHKTKHNPRVNCWRKNEILGLTWDEIDEADGVIRLSPARSKTLVERILPISQPIAEALARRRARRDPDSPLIFHRDGFPVRRWRTAWRTACPSRIRCQAATGSWTQSRQWETQRTLFSSAWATVCPPTKVDGVWPFNDAWLRTSL